MGSTTQKNLASSFYVHIFMCIFSSYFKIYMQVGCTPMDLGPMVWVQPYNS